MIFVGDIAMPYEDDTVLEDASGVLKKGVIANLEGCIVDRVPEKNLSVYNSQKVIPFLKEHNIVAVSLANNHILDEKEYFNFTKTELGRQGIRSFGAGNDESEARDYIKLLSDDKEYYLLGYAWEVTGIRNRKKGIKISVLKRHKVLEDIKKIKEKNIDANIICYMHWGYELEAYPLPKDRELAREMIDAGACAVIGCHSHCIQGVELYQGKPIVYGLGNFFFPEGKYLNGKLNYPEWAHTAIAFEIEGEEYKCHWFQYFREKNIIKYIGTTAIDDVQMRQRTPYSGMKQAEYIKWFRENRRKKKLLPVFMTSKEGVQDYLNRLWCRVRGEIIKSLFRLGLKGGPV